MRMMMCGAALLAAGAATADGYAGHDGVRLFTEMPCGRVIAMIDAEPVPGVGIDVMMLRETQRGMAWGFLLGFDTARGGLHAKGQTTLERLRDACAASPEATAQELLSGF